MSLDLNAASTVIVTFFQDHTATTKHEETLALQDLRDRISTTTAAEKVALPWLKLARFGDSMTDRGSLRHNANVIEITGLEADYDGERVAFDDVCTSLLRTGVAALVYTSPSHSEDAPRWRVLAPLSQPYPPARRDQFLGRLNGLLQGALSRESWTLSQSYYFGSINQNPSHRTQLCIGTPIDLLDALDDIAVNKPAPHRGNDADQPASVGGSADQVRISDARVDGFRRSVLATLRHQAIDGQKHDALLRAAITIGGIQTDGGFSDAEAWGWMRGCLPDSVEDWAAAERTAVWGLAQGRARPLKLEDREQIPGGHLNGHAGNGAAASPQPGEGGAPPSPPEGEHAPLPNDTTTEPPRSRRKPRTDQPPPYTPADLWDPWEDPPPPAWPNAILSRATEDTLALVSLRDGIDIGTLAMSIIAAGSAAAPKDARFFAYSRRETGWSVPPIFWLMLIADSGLRKTILDQLAFAPLRHVQSEIWRPYSRALRDWKLAPPKGRGPKPAEPHSYIVDDITPEKLGDILAATTRGTAMFKDELVGLFEFDRYRKGGGEAARGFFLSAYEDAPRTVHRVGRDSQNIEHTGLSIFGGIQPARLADFKDLASDGLLQRFAPLRTPPAVAARPEIDIGTGLDVLHQAIAALCRLEGRNYITTPEGTALIQETEQAAFGYATIRDFNAGWPGFCLKLHGTHARLALVLHMLETPEEPVIATATVERAHRLAQSFVLQHAKDFYATISGGHQDRQRDIAGWLLTRQDGNTALDQWERVLPSDLTSGVKSCRPLTSKGIGEALDPFITRGWLVAETDYPGNRAWLFNPAIRIHLVERQRAERERRESIRAQIEGIAWHRH